MNEQLNFPKTVPPQHQDKQPGIESIMNPRPVFDMPSYVPSNKLAGKTAIITGGDSGIGRAAAIAYAKEGADLAILYLDEHDDAQGTKKIIEGIGRRCLVIAGDIGDEAFCFEAVKKVMDEFKKIDILVNNAAEQHPQNSIEDITKEQLERTFKTNIFGMFYMTKAVLPHLKADAVIINTASITAYEGHKTLIDYSSTKGAIVSFTRSLSLSLQDRDIRVNAIAPGPIWTPLIPASFSADEVGKFGSKASMGRPGQPVELAPAYVFLASSDSNYISGQTIHVNGGTIVNG
jgi:NAD(P)-dependent dehydrogenase (short-subunit alcohol dehydrogenase family)